MTSVARLRRYVGLILYYGIATRLPSKGPLGEPSRWVRQELARMFLHHVGERVNLGPDVYLGDGAEVQIGNRSGLDSGCRVYGALIMGDEVMVGPDVAFLSGHHRYDRLDEPIGWQGIERRPPRIGDGVWIGARATILPGRVVGDGAIVGACAVVSRDVPPLAIVGGNPAAVIGMRGLARDAPAELAS